MIEAVTIPEGQRGKWRIERFTVDKAASDNTRLHAMFSRSRRGYVPPGTYTKLVHERRGVVMSDTPDEQRDHYPIVQRARGHVLINGLGIGMVLGAVLKKPEVERVTVVEIDPDVIALVAPSYASERVEIVNANAFEYQLPKQSRYGAVWHDIWDDICGDNAPQMTRLKRKYGHRAHWQGCWCEYECKPRRRR